MGIAKPKAVPERGPAKSSAAPAKPLKRGLPGDEGTRSAERDRFTAEHHETLRRLGK